MKLTENAIILLGLVLSTADAQDNLNVIGFGSGNGVYDVANQHPLNKTSLTFPGFNFTADPATTTNASSGQWTFNVGLSIINIDTNQTNYPLSTATNATSNVLNVAYSVDFPGNQLPSPNDTDWTMCTYVVDVPWTQSVLNRASSDSGDCAAVLGASCLNKVREGWRNPSSTASSGCPRVPSFTSFSECDSISTNGYGAYSAAINSVLIDSSNRSAGVEGLHSGQVFSYERSNKFNGSTATSNYLEFASKLRMTVLTFSPSVNYTANHTGSPSQVGEVRTFCTMFDTKAASPNAGSSLRMGPTSQVVMGLPMLLLIWQVLSLLIM